jgi:hypothetical protein
MEEMEDTTSAQAPPPDMARPQTGKRRNAMKTIGIVAVVVLILAIIGAVLYGLAANPPVTAVLRDISIIVLALVTIVTGIFVAVLVFQLQSLIVLLRDEIYPILDSVNQTVSTVRGTTTFVSDAVVTPMITAASYASAVRQSIRALTGDPSRKKRARQSSDQEQ